MERAVIQEKRGAAGAAEYSLVAEGLNLKEVLGIEGVDFKNTR